jgi:peptidoglycan/LPS O-acetylase OafA/YrhL
VLWIHASVVVHGGGLSSGALGAIEAHFGIALTIFFLLSGFLLYRPFVAARVLGAPPIRFRDYGRNRFLRIVPIYWVALTVLAIYPGLAGVFTDNWWVYYGFLQVYFPLYTGGPECSEQPLYCGIAQTWSLGVEIAFYALLPLFAVFLGTRLKRNREGWVRQELLLLGALSAVSVVVRVWGARADPDTYWLVSTLASNFLWIALGMGLAVLSVALQGREHENRWSRLVIEKPGWLWAGAGGLYLLLAFAVLPRLPFNFAYDDFDTVAQYLGYSVMAVLLVAPAVFGDRSGGWPRRALANRFIAWLGMISYSFYLWHLVLADWLAKRGALDWLPGTPMLSLTIATFVLTTAVAAASYYLVERPCLRYKSRGPRRGPRPAPVAPGAPAVAE